MTAHAMPSGQEAPAGIREVLANRNFLALWLAQLLSQTAQNAIFLVLLYVIEQQTRSTTLAAVMVVTFLIPAIILGVGAGVVVDHVDKKVVLVTTNVLRAIVTLLFVLFIDALPLLFVVNFFFSCISQFFAPAEAATIPFLVKRRELIAANGMFNVTISFAQLLGFIVFGPALFARFGPNLTFIVIAATFAICSGLCVIIPREGRRATGLSAEERRNALVGVFLEIREGFRVLRGERGIALAVGYFAMANSIILVLATIAPGFVARVVNVSVDNAVILLAPAFLGIVTATVATPRLARGINKLTLVNTGISMMSGGLATLGLVAMLRFLMGTDVALAQGPLGFLGSDNGIRVVIMVFAVFIGLGYGLINIPAQTLLMEQTPEQVRGRIFAVQLTLTNVISVLPLLFAATIADLLGIEAVLFILAVFVGIAGWFAALQQRALRPPHPIPQTGDAVE